MLFIILEVFKAKNTSGALQENMSEKTLDKLMGVILTNSKDWEKGRVKKTIVTTVEEQEDDEENV